jgi:hypothetical protein
MKMWTLLVLEAVGRLESGPLAIPLFFMSQGRLFLLFPTAEDWHMYMMHNPTCTYDTITYVVKGGE